MLSSLLSSLFSKYLLGGIASLIVITNPPSKIPLFISLTSSMSLADRKKQAAWACYYTAALMLTFLAIGNFLLEFFGVSLGAVRVAGGFVVAILGYDLLFGARIQGGSPVVRRDKEDYAFFPLAMPAIGGPGTIAVLIGISSEIVEIPALADKAIAFVMTGIAILVTCFVIWIVLRCADLLATRLGPSGILVISKLMGFFLICMGVQFMGSGIRTFLAGS